MKKLVWIWVVSSAVLVSVFSSSNLLADSETDFWIAVPINNSLPPIDHSEWDEFLSNHLSDSAHPTWRHRFDPTGVGRKDKKVLENYIESLEDIDPRYYGFEEQLAYWLNLYNAITVSFLIEADKFSDVEDHRDEQVVTIADKEISQRYIAEKILMPTWQDSSLYFLLSCAAVDCPPVPYKAFSAKLDARQQSKPAMQAYMDGPEGLRLEGGKLHLPRAVEHFATYYDDESGLLKRLAFTVSDDMALKILGYSGPIVYSDYAVLASPN